MVGKLPLKTMSLVLVVTILVAVSGCDMGTYEKRLNEANPETNATENNT